MATLGKGTPSQWRYYVNMEERKRRDRARLGECIREMEDEREQWAADEQQRAADEAAERLIREEEQVVKEEEDDDPNDMLPFKRAANMEQKKMMDAVEQQTTADINTVAFQTKIGRKHNKAAEAATAQSTAPALSPSSASAFPPLSSPSSKAGVPFASQSAFAQAGALSAVALPSIQPAQPKHRSTASLTFEAEYKRNEGRQQRARARQSSDADDSKQQQNEPPSLQLSKLQELRVAVAKAIPLYGRPSGEEDGEEEKEQILHAPTLVKIAKAAALLAATQRVGVGKNGVSDKRHSVQRSGMQPISRK